MARVGRPDARFLGGPDMGGRFTTAAVVLDGTARGGPGGDDEGNEDRTDALTGRVTSQAESGRSLR